LIAAERDHTKIDVGIKVLQHRNLNDFEEFHSAHGRDFTDYRFALEEEPIELCI
jgi:hypothetical protein